jgi:hypothetical protein
MAAVRPYLIIPAVLVAVLVAVGLYFDLRGSSQYTLLNTQTCFVAHGYKAVAVTDKALPSSGGQLYVTLKQRGFGHIYIDFGRNAAEALAIRQRAMDLAEGSLKAHHAGEPLVQLLSGVRVQKNVFFYSDQGAVTVEAQQEIDTCLS